MVTSHFLASHLYDRHRDPFDGLLVSPAIPEHLPIISADPSLAAYEIEFADDTKWPGIVF